ncbi:hypothetical protein WMY93_028790 [Mugilogobius chulae]|uniref:Uncharacterized protein n=1 Tax=Mugilogobius chulae TaxID=88201 RepID=A0AAW0MVI7_9GOBI
MRGRHWAEAGVTAVLLLSEMVIGQLCKSSITVLDGFHTLFLLLNTLSVSVLHKFSLAKPQTTAPSAQVCVDYGAKRLQPAAVFISNLFLLSINTIYLTELCSFVLEPAAAQRPLLLVATGAVSLVVKMFLFGLHVQRVHWNHVQTDPHIEVNHEALFEEEKAQAELGGVFNNHKPKRCRSSQHKAALTISNPNTLNPSEEITEHQPNGACGQHSSLMLSNGQTPTSVQPSPEIKAVPHSLLSSCVHFCETLLTSFLVLVNGLVTLSLSATCLHKSKLCGLLVYLDPALSLLAVILLIAKAIPLVFRHAQLLVQCAPNHISVEEVGQKIVNVPGVKAMHELHVWKLTESFIVASVHVQCCTPLQNRCTDVILEVTRVLKSVGVTCSTIQPEFTDQGSCSLACGKACTGNMCCSHLEEQYKMLKTEKTEEEP